MKVLVTGATGSIGRLIVHELLKQNVHVIATSKDESKAADLKANANVSYLPYDFHSNSSDNLFEYFGRPDLLVHNAWEKLTDFRSEEHLTTILPNHKNFIENLINNGLKHFNGIGTCYECGLQEGMLVDGHESQPTLAYAKAKDELRKYVSDLCSSKKVIFKWIRIFYVFGPTIGRKNLYMLLNEAIHKGDTDFNMSGGEQIRDFLSPQEIAFNISKISIQKEVDGGINCCSGVPVKLKDFITDYLNKNNCQVRLNLGFYPYPDYEPMETWGSRIKLDKILKK